ncbi:MAG TPA: pyrrolo-quinoline quinone [Planctomycetes bacterium]|nr:pyrrolo-quinoline quinone [Planctomycetota bacterium]
MSNARRHPRIATLGASLLLAVCAPPARAGDQPQWGERFTRNMIAEERGLPAAFDPEKNENIRWQVLIGNETYGTPIVAAGRVLIGTNNARPRDERRKGERGVLLCLDEKDGSFLWQLIVPKLGGDPLRDWPSAGICSPPTVEGDRIYIVSNRGEVMCLDIDGQADGNDGPFLGEAALMAAKDEEPLALTPRDADIVWTFDLRNDAGVHQHDSAHASILIHGRFLYLNTSNGVDSTHRAIAAPEAPALVVFDKETGRLVARESEGISARTFHCNWSSPLLAEIDGGPQILFAGGDGIVYAFAPLAALPPAGAIETLTTIWRFDCDPAAPKENIHQYVSNRRESPSNVKGMPVFYKNRVYAASGGDIWWGKREAKLTCFTPGGTGDITAKAARWTYPLKEHCCGTPSISNGLVFIGDLGRLVHCVDAETGAPCWTHETRGEVWASTLVADGKVYVGTRRGEFSIFAAEREKKVLATVMLDGPVCSSATAANGTVYVATFSRLYAIGLPR